MSDAADSIETIVIESCTVVWYQDGKDWKIDESSCMIEMQVVRIMTPEQILYRDSLNRENTASRMRMRMLNEMAKSNGSGNGTGNSS